MRNDIIGHIIGHIIAGTIIGLLVSIPVIYKLISTTITGGQVTATAVIAAALILSIATLATATNAYHFHHAEKKIRAAGLTVTAKRINAHASDSLHRFNALTVAVTFGGILYVVADLVTVTTLTAIGVPVLIATTIAAVAAVMVYVAAVLEAYPHTLHAIRHDAKAIR